MRKHPSSFKLTPGPVKEANDALVNAGKDSEPVTLYEVCVGRRSLIIEIDGQVQSLFQKSDSFNPENHLPYFLLSSGDAEIARKIGTCSGDDTDTTLCPMSQK